MIDKTQKRSLFVRILFVLFAVALAFCSVSLALNDGKYKASADSLSYDLLLVRFGEFDFLGFLYPDIATYKTGVIFSSDYDYSGDIAGFGVDLTGYSYGESDSSFYAYIYDVSQLPASDSYFISYSYSYDFIPFSDLSDVLAIFDDPTLDDHLSDGSYAFGCTFVFSDSTIVLTAYLPVNQYTSAFTLDQQTVTESVTDVWTSIFNWLTTSVNSLLSILYVNGELTILGVLVVMSLGISIFFLLLAVVSNFFHLRN